MNTNELELVISAPEKIFISIQPILIDQLSLPAFRADPAFGNGPAAGGILKSYSFSSGNRRASTIQMES
jgi:hypothetical protein